MSQHTFSYVKLYEESKNNIKNAKMIMAAIKIQDGGNKEMYVF